MTSQSKWVEHELVPNSQQLGRDQSKRDGTRAETRFCLSTKRRSPFKSAGASVQSTAGSRGVRISGSHAGYTMFQDSVKGTGYPLHSPVSPSLPLPCITMYHHISTGLHSHFEMNCAAHRSSLSLGVWWYKNKMNNELVPLLISLLHSADFTYSLPQHTQLHLVCTADLCVPHYTYSKELLFPKHVKTTVFATEATSFMFLWPCIVSKVWREKKTNKMQQLDVYY